MGQAGSLEKSPLSETSAEAMEQLASIFQAYNQTTERLHSSYQRLKDEVNQLRRELKQKNEQLERKSRLAALGEMAAGMAHEIRNPLGAVRLYASLLEGESQTESSSLEWVQKIIKAVSTLDTIVTDMLTFTQDQACQKTQVNLAALLTEVVDYARPHIKSGSVQVVIDIGDEVTVDIDINMMRRVFLNLILNAINVVEGDGRVVISAKRCPDSSDYKVHISVSDNGPGINPEIMNKIFNPFFTTRDSGTGLGLAIVHRLVECHGGMITVLNNKDGGANFVILLP
ncbi:MAG: hypothetical protein JW860_16140 [Sedimentisphaerales bacterium]|nr:hypothetical protein [Sedimentisphaerales bacterium]